MDDDLLAQILLIQPKQALKIWELANRSIQQAKEVKKLCVCRLAIFHDMMELSERVASVHQLIYFSTCKGKMVRSNYMWSCTGL